MLAGFCRAIGFGGPPPPPGGGPCGGPPGGGPMGPPGRWGWFAISLGSLSRDTEGDFGEEIVALLVLANGVHRADDDLIRDRRVRADRDAHLVLELGGRAFQLDDARLQRVVVVVVVLRRDGDA